VYVGIQIFLCRHFVSLVLRQRQRYGLIDTATIILTVNDPQDKLGSGGATLNALLVATEHLSAKAGYSVS
jgi:fucokinase